MIITVKLINTFIISHSNHFFYQQMSLSFFSLEWHNEIDPFMLSEIYNTGPETPQKSPAKQALENRNSVLS